MSHVGRYPKTFCNLLFRILQVWIVKALMQRNVMKKTNAERLRLGKRRRRKVEGIGYFLEKIKGLFMVGTSVLHIGFLGKTGRICLCNARLSVASPSREKRQDPLRVFIGHDFDLSHDRAKQSIQIEFWKMTLFNA